jgi:hypothetical protein
MSRRLSPSQPALPIIRLGTVLVLACMLIPTSSAGQLPLAPTAWAPERTIASSSFPDSSSPRRFTFHPLQVEAKPRHKSPVLAWFLSWLVPGGGQGYNGQWTKAAAFFVPAAVGFGLAASGDGFSCSGDCGTRDVGLVILAAASIGSQIEAPIAASKINREARKASPSQVGLTLARISF